LRVQAGSSTQSDAALSTERIRTLNSVPNVTATDLARGVRKPGAKAPRPGDPPPPPFLVKFTTVGRAAVRRYHQSGAPAATAYLTNVLARELAHPNASMQTNARNTVDGLASYIAADLADGRTFKQFGDRVNVQMPSGVVRTAIDVVVASPTGLTARAVYWDGLHISAAQAATIAYPFAVALQQLFPNDSPELVEVWQVRRNETHGVTVSTALAQAGAADAILAGL
jgi:hypothetical protein